MDKIIIFDLDNLSQKEKELKKRIITLSIFNACYLVGIILFIIFLNRDNYIIFAILLSLSLFLAFSSTFFYAKVFLKPRKAEIKFIKKLVPFETKRATNIDNINISKSILNKYGFSFYPITYIRKEKEKEIYLEINKLEELDDFKIDTIYFKNRYIVEITGEYKNGKKA